jgi:hypothetical protein
LDGPAKKEEEEAMELLPPMPAILERFDERLAGIVPILGARLEILAMLAADADDEGGLFWLLARLDAAAAKLSKR